MNCTSCERKGVYKNQGTVYCKEHFLDYFESKVFKTISKYNLLERGDKVCVATSGGKDSLSALYLVGKFCRPKDIEFFALAVDEGIEGYRDKTLEDLKLFCDEHKIKLKVVSFKESFGASLDDVKDKAMSEHQKKPCTVCGIFRRTLLNKASRELGATKIVTGHNLDDDAQTFLMNLFQGNMSHNAKMGPITGLKQDPKFISRVKPLYFVTEQECRLFAFLRGFKVDFAECPNTNLAFRVHVRDHLNEIASRLPNAKYGVVNAFLEILPDLKDKYRRSVDLKSCTVCGEPTTLQVCNTCLLEEKLCKQFQIS